MADAPIQVAALFQGTLVLEEPFHYYRRHSQNLFAIDARDKARLRRKSKMANLVYRQLPGMSAFSGIVRLSRGKGVSLCRCVRHSRASTYQAFWQMDMVFIPASSPVFQVAEFR